MKYHVTMRNPKSGKVEVYTTTASNTSELQLSLDFWKNEASYEIISVNEVLE